MNRILIDTMHLGRLLNDDSYLELAGAISDGDIETICSVISLLELTKRLGIAMQAGELRLKYDIPTADSLIAATGIVGNTTNVLTDDTRHFSPIKKLIKIIDLETATNLGRKK